MRPRHGADIFGFTSSADHEAWIKAQAAVMRRMPGGVAVDPATIRPITEVAANARPAVARVSINFWLADCPYAGCPVPNAAVMVTPGDPFMCPHCGNRDAGGAWRPVVWPDEHEQIGDILAVRPLENQHWTPGETLDDLRRENADHGLDA